jgi:hypothetical protein
MKEDEYLELKRQAKACRIFFKSTKYSPSTSADVPVDHRDKFTVVQGLGHASFSTYGYIPNSETPDKPWRLGNKLRVTRLVHCAAKCRRENRNEAGWRNEVEFRLFEGFDIEVAR